MKKFVSAALALTLTAALTPAAFAAEDVVPISAPGPQTAYNAKIFVNGVSIDAERIPAVSTDIPLRAVAEADYGFANWYPEENLSQFDLDGNSIAIDTATGVITLNDAVVDGMTAAFVSGVTFVPAALLEKLDGYKVQTGGAPELNAEYAYAITTPNALPLTKLAREIVEATGMASSQKNTAEELRDYLKIDPAHYDEVISFSSMMVNSDAVVLGKVAEGADKNAVKAELEARRAAIQQSFEQYLPEPLEKAKAGRVVESGGYVMLIISPDVEKAVELFEAGVKAL